MQFTIQKQITQGWSKDQKYYVVDQKGSSYLYRISDLSQYETKQAGFNRMKQVAKLGIPMCQPIEFGTCEKGVYSIQSWIDGDCAEIVLSNYPKNKQYHYGIQAGKILRKIHTIPACHLQEDWETRFNRKIDRNIKNYHECPIQYEHGQVFIDYINENRHLLKNRPQTYQHGDYHTGNMIIDPHGNLYVIDFDRNDDGDPWEEFNRIIWCAQISPDFASGMIDGYFDDHIPSTFWKLLALYISSNALSSISWAMPYGQQEIDVMLKLAKEILTWYDHMHNPIPTWYKAHKNH